MNYKPESNDEAMIALTTPTGTVGSKVLRHLLEDSTVGIRVLARHPAKLADEVLERVQIVKGSLDDPVALRQLLTGVTTLFWCQPDTPAASDYVGAYEALARTGARTIREAGVSRVVAISAVGEPGEIPAGPITALHRMEAILVETGADTRFLRCGSFFENLLWQWESIVDQGTFVYPAPGDVPGPQLATADIARVAADLMTDPAWAGQECVLLPGPNDLSFDEMAAILSRAVGKPVRYEAADSRDYVAALEAMGQSTSAAKGLVDMFQFLASAYRPPTTADRALTPTTLADWLNSQECEVLPQ